MLRTALPGKIHEEVNGWSCCSFREERFVSTMKCDRKQQYIPLRTLSSKWERKSTVFCSRLAGCDVDHQSDWLCVATWQLQQSELSCISAMSGEQTSQLFLVFIFKFVIHSRTLAKRHGWRFIMACHPLYTMSLERRRMQRFLNSSKYCL